MKVKKIISIIFYVIAIFFLLLYDVAEILPHLSLSETGRLFLLCGSCLFLFVGGVLWSKCVQNNKAMKINLWIFFALYLVLLITLTLFDPMWGRNRFDMFNWDNEGLKIYIENSLNLIPFKTIGGYISDMFSSLKSTSTIFYNLLGNVVCLMPFAFFLPLLFKKIDNVKKFLITILCITLGIEVLQFITFSGSCDIDDIILNTLGAFVMYLILQIKSVKNLIRNIFLLEKNEINKKQIIVIAIIVFIIICMCVILIKIRGRYYDKALDEYTAKYNYNIQIIDESEATDTALDMFYEDELYEYYFSSIKSDYVYAVINGTEKHLVKDLLNNNPTEYVIRIDRLERAGLDFIKKDKYERIDLTISGEVYLNEEISNNQVFELKEAAVSYGISETKYEIFIIPKKSGNSNLKLNFYNRENENEIVETREYIITVDENLQVKKEHTINLFKLEEISSITIDTLSQYNNKKEFKDEESIKEIYDIFIDKKTHIENINDVPVNPDILYFVKFKNVSGKSKSAYIYKKDNKYYIEQPYNGIYLITEAEYTMVEKYIK